MSARSVESFWARELLDERGALGMLRPPFGESMPHRFAVGSALKDIEREARILLHRRRQGFAEATNQFNHFDPEAGSFQPRHADAQYAVARKYDCKDWNELRKRLTRCGP